MTWGADAEGISFVNEKMDIADIIEAIVLICEF